MSHPTETISLRRHKHPHKELLRRYRYYGAQKGYFSSALVAILYFCASVAVAFYALSYATERASNSVTDLILSNTPALDVDALFAYGTLLLIAYAALVLLAHPKRIPFALNCLATFYMIRSLFVTLTHIGPFPTQPPSGDWGTVLSHFLFSADLFFSAHTGVAFLLALVFWRDTVLRYTFLAWSLYMALVVLAGHYHYSIDVASAYFITFTIYKICEWLFPGSRALFLSDPVMQT